jgi:hypothetical protein
MSEEEAKENPYFNEWLKNAKANLSEDKFAMFSSLIEYPLPSTGVVDSIKDQYAKFFEAKDQYFDIITKDESLKKELKSYLTSIGEEKFWREQALDLMFSSVNSIVLVNLPVFDNDENTTKPFFEIVEIDIVHDVKTENKKLEYLIYRHEKKGEKQYYVVVDSNYYRMYWQDGEKVQMESESLHGLGEVPANFLFQEPLTNTNDIVKRSGISSVLGNLDTFVRKYTSKEYLDLYNSFPIYWKYEEDEDDEFFTTTVKEAIEDTINNPIEVERIAAGLLDERKKKNRLLGAGTVISVPAPADNTEPDLRDPVGIISPDKTSLDYNTSEVERLEDRIYRKATGRPQEKEIADRPVASQIQSQYEGERNVLLWLSSQFSFSREWLVGTICRMYSDQEVTVTADFGSEFFIEDEKSVLENFKLYKEAGASQGAIGMRNDSFIQVSTKGKPVERERLQILKHLEPMPTLSLSEAIEYATSDFIDFKQLDLKINFSERVDKFERENGSIIAYKQTEPFGKKIDAIKSILYSYGKDKKFDNGLGSNKSMGQLGQGAKTNVTK